MSISSVASAVALRYPRPLPNSILPQWARYIRYQAHDTGFDPDELADARRWRQSFTVDKLPNGHTTYSRSSGPGGQHVNKTETKATSSWTVSELFAGLPRLLHAAVRSSKYYSKRNDALSIQAQTERSRSANTEENRQKLYEELCKIYKDMVPNESSPDKKKKYEALEKASHENRIKEKKHQASKKAIRKGGSRGDY